MRYQEHTAQHIPKSESDSRRLNFANLIQPLKNDMTFLVCILIVQEVITVFLCRIQTIDLNFCLSPDLFVLDGLIRPLLHIKTPNVP